MPPTKMAFLDAESCTHRFTNNELFTFAKDRFNSAFSPTSVVRHTKRSVVTLYSLELYIIDNKRLTKVYFLHEINQHNQLQASLETELLLSAAQTSNSPRPLAGSSAVHPMRHLAACGVV